MFARTRLILAALLAIAAATPALARPAAEIATPETRARDARIDRFFARATIDLRQAAAAALGTTAIGAITLAPPPPPAPPVRPSLATLTPKQLASLRRGYAQMIAWNSAPHGSANFKRSLVYWANMHSYIGNGCAAASGLTKPGMSGLSLQSATTPDELATWCTCQHGTDQFLTWHRMYVWYFEQVLRAASGDPDLMLPFWDYEADGHIPASYRAATYVDGGASKPNPLFVANRQAQLNAGTAAIDSAFTSTGNAMGKTSYLPFNSALEQTPHGSVHCATGVQSCPSGYMGFVPSAGNDPIFYSHHANIDRLYECWLQVKLADRLPKGAILAGKFKFIDGAGTLVERQVSDMLTTKQLGYGYPSAGGGCPIRRLRLPQFITRENPIKIYELAGPVRLAPGVTRVPITIARQTGPALAAAPETRPHLVLDGFAYDELPGVLYKVFLEGPGGRRVLIGAINFFNATAPDHQAMAGMDMPRPEAPSFDVTDALRSFGPASKFQLAIEPASGVTTARRPGLAAPPLPTVNPRANVRIGAVRMEMR